MTFGSNEYRPYHRGFPFFSLWGIRFGNLFFPKSLVQDEKYDDYGLTSRVYIFMKRLGQDYRTIMLMDSEERDELFKMEMDLIEEEKKQAEEMKKHK